MHMIGQFRDLDDPDSFGWMRGFMTWTRVSGRSRLSTVARFGKRTAGLPTTR
jgi:hypothetical protein